MQPKVYRLFPLYNVIFTGWGCAMTTGQKIRRIREDAKLNQEQFAELLNVTRQSVSKWESDKNFPETNRLIFLCNNFDVSIEYLLDENITEIEKQKDAYSYEEIIDIHKDINKHQRKRVLKLLERVAGVLLIVEIFQVIFNVIASGYLIPSELNVLYLDWDTDSFIRGFVPNLVLIPLVITLVLWIYDKYNNIFRDSDFRNLLSNGQDTEIIDKKYKKKTVQLISFINLAFLFGALFKITSANVIFTFLDTFAIPMNGRGVTDTPSIATMLHQIFSLNVVSIALYVLIIAVITYVLLNISIKEKKFLYFVPVLGLLLVLLLLNNFFLGLLLLVLIITNSLLSVLIIRYYTHKPLLRLAIIYTVLITLFSLFGSYVEYVSFGGFVDDPNTIAALAMFEDLAIAQSVANTYLVSIIVDGLVGIDLLPLYGLVIYFIVNLYNKWRKNEKRLKFLNATFLVFVGTVVISLIGSFVVFLMSFTMYATMNYSLNNDSPYTTTILSNQCFSDEFLSREMGTDLIKDNRVFVNCFDTTEGVYSVYYTVESYGKDSLFDFYYEEVVYDEVIVENQDGNIVLRLDYTNSELQIQVTSKDEADEGYMNIITHRYLTKDIDWTEADLEDYNVVVYDIHGNQLKEFEGVMIHIAQRKADQLHRDGHKYLFINNEAYCVDLSEDEPKMFIYDFSDDSVVPLTQEEWQEYNQSQWNE